MYDWQENSEYQRRLDSLCQIRELLSKSPAREQTCPQRRQLAQHTPEYLARYGCHVERCFWCEPISIRYLTAPGKPDLLYVE